ASRIRAGRAKGLFYFLAVALSGGIGTNTLSRLWGGDRPAFGFWWSVDFAVGIACVAVMAVAGLSLYRLRHSLFDHEVVTEHDRVSDPRRVLITALSFEGFHGTDPNTRSRRGDLLLEAVENDPRLGLDLFRRPKNEFEASLGEMGVDAAPWRDTPWLTN